MKIILTLLFSVAVITVFAQLPSDKIFQKYKNAKGITYSAVNQEGKDSTTGKPIPMYLRTLSIKKDNPLHKTIVADCQKILQHKDYKNILTSHEDDNKTDVEKLDKGKDFEILVLTSDDDETTFVSISAKNLTEAQKKQVSISNK